jgi:DNA-binding CsgD family transcriptional regulator
MSVYQFPSLNCLTRRQRTVLELRAQGLAYKEIAARVGLAEGTIKIYFTRDITRKLGLKTHEIVPEYFRLERLDYMRVKAIALSDWCRKHGKSVTPEALADMECIMAHMVQEIFTPDTLPSRTDQSPVPSETARSDRYTRPELRPSI